LDSPEAAYGSSADNPVFHQASLLIVGVNSWNDPRLTAGQPTGHMWWDRVAEHLLDWMPRRARLVHYGAFEDMLGEGRPEAYRALLADGARIHPSQGPVSDWELTAAAQHHLHRLGYPAPHSVAVAFQGETLVVFPPAEDIDENLVWVEPEQGRLRVLGPVPSRVAHAVGVPHVTALLLARVPPTAPGVEGKLLVHRRSPLKRVSPAKLDFNGGHTGFEGALLQPTLRDDPAVLEAAVFRTALREANEELRCEPAHFFREADLTRLGGFGEFSTGMDHPGSGNVEFSTAYLVRLTAEVTVRIFDSDGKGERELEVGAFSLDDLLDGFGRDPEAYADGAARILRRLLADRERGHTALEDDLRQLLR
jgi:hypothetical protein